MPASLIIIMLLVLIIICMIFASIPTHRPPEEMTRDQIYQLFIKEKGIADSQLNTIKIIRAQLESSEKLVSDLKRHAHEVAATLSRQKIKESEEQCRLKINEALKQCSEKTAASKSEAERCNLEKEKADNLLKERAKSERWFSIYLAEYQTAKQMALVHWLKNKKNPAHTTAAKIEQLVKSDLRTALGEITALTAKIAEYESLFPGIDEYVEKTNYAENDPLEDGGRKWLSDEEFKTLSVSERNQLILDRYHTKHTKSKWQIGRDYELYIGHVFRRKGYTNIIQYGIEKKLEDLGIDIIATNPKTGKLAFIQCKNWGSFRTVRENTVTQLYAGALIHMLNTGQNPALAEYHICTATTASDLAKQCAKILGVELHENIALGTYPSIKCHKDTDNSGFGTKIYHLPIDQMYDRTISVDHYAATVEEAEQLGYRRAFRWHGNNPPP